MSYELRRMILAEERHSNTKAPMPDSLDWFWFDAECPDGLTDSGKRFDELKPGDVWAVGHESPVESVVWARYYSIYEREADGTVSHVVDLDNEADARAKLMALRLPAVAPEWVDCLKEAHRCYEIEARTAENLANRSYFSQWAARFKAAIDHVEGDG